MAALLKPTFDQLIVEHLDITAPEHAVEIKTDSKGVLWVNIGPVCVLRVCRVKKFVVCLDHLTEQG